MGLNIKETWLRCTEETAHPYIHHGARLLVEGAAIYCVLRSAGLNNLRQTTLLMAVSGRLQALAHPLIVKKVCEKSEDPILQAAVFLISGGILDKVGDCALVKLGVQLLGWKLNLAIYGVNILMTRILFPSKSQDQQSSCESNDFVIIDKTGAV